MSARIDTTARVFLKRGPVIFLSAPSFQEAADDFADQRPIRGTTTKGHPIIIGHGAIEDIEGQPEPTAVEYASDVLLGRMFVVRGGEYADTQSTNGMRPLIEGGDNYQDCVVLRSEYADDASVDADLLVVNLATDKYAWVNPAVPDEAIERLARIARLLAEVDTLCDAEYADTSDRSQVDLGHAVGMTNKLDALSEDQRNAIVHLRQRGFIDTAVACSNWQFVEQYLAAQSFSSDVLVLTDCASGDPEHDGNAGLVVGYTDSPGQGIPGTFQVDMVGAGGPTRDVPMRDIRCVLDWSHLNHDDDNSQTEIGTRRELAAASRR